MLEFINKKNVFLFLLGISCCFNACTPEYEGSDGRQTPRIKVLDVTALEDSEMLTGVVSLSWSFTQEVKVDYVVSETMVSSAKAGEDFVLAEGQVIFAPGDTVANFQVELIPDVISEPDERFQIQISNPVYGKIITSTAVATIEDDDEGFFIDDSGPTSPLEYQGLSLVWQDEFSDDNINLDNWTHEIGGHGWGNNELQYYTDRTTNSFQTLGYLVIEARVEQQGNNDYTSARIISQGKKQFQYGRIDFRAKLPEGRGIWPALWMLGANFSSVGWPACGEIDIMEMIGSQTSLIHGTAHFGNSAADRDSDGSSSFLLNESYSDMFHVYSIIWKEDSIEWLRDGITFHSLTPADVAPYNWPFNDEFFFIMNVAVGGNWPGSPDGTTAFPQQMVVDYVRVFQ